MKKIIRLKEEWKKELTPEQYQVMFENGTEAPFSGKYYLSKETGTYHCAACDNPLFSSDAKFESGCGWPSFFEPISKESVEYVVDTSHGMNRTEVTCFRCGAHLGHVFPDAPGTPTGQRYCINSVALDLEKNKERE